MAQDDTAGILVNGLHYGIVCSLGIKQRRLRHRIGDPRSFQSFQRPHHRIVLVARDHGVSAVLQAGFDGDIQPVGGVHGEHHPFRVLQSEIISRQTAAVINLLSRPHSGLVPGPAGISAALHGLNHGPPHRGWLLQGGCGIVKIDHSTTSRQPAEVFS